MKRFFFVVVLFFVFVNPCFADFDFPFLSGSTSQTYTMTLESVNGSNAGKFWTGSAWSANATDLACTEKGGTNGVAEYKLTTAVTSTYLATWGNNVLLNVIGHDSSGDTVGVGAWCLRCSEKFQREHPDFSPMYSE